MNCPDAVVGFFQPNVLVSHRVREIEQLLTPESERPRAGDPFHLEMAGILDIVILCYLHITFVIYV